MAKKENIKNEVVIRIYIGFFMICLLGLGIVGRTFYIQSVKGNYYRSMADSLTIYPVMIRAERGNIYASDGSLLATSLPVFDLYIDFKAEGLTDELFNQNIDSVCLLLSQTFRDKSADEYKRLFKKNRTKKNRYFSLHKNVPYDVVTKMKTWPWLKLGPNKSGLIQEFKEQRDHPFGAMALRTLGVDENLDGEYSSGIEQKYNTILQGTAGKQLVQKLGAGVVRPLDNKEDVSPQPGKDIYTTIDVSIQDVAHDALRRALIHHQADHGCVIVMEVKTGKLRAIANLGRKDSVNYVEFLNYAVGETTEPGSTFKLATVASLMEDGLVNKNTKVDCGNGVAVFKNLTIRDHEAPKNPIMDVKKIIEVSSNVGVAKLANTNYGHQSKQFYKHLKEFGFADKIDLEIAGAGEPVLAKPEKWSGVSAAFLAHGYELRVTPLHTLQFYNAIANGGVLVKPTLIEKIKYFANTIDSTKAKENKILNEKTVSDLREILESVVTNGTAMNLKTDYLQIAGKTGTAKIADKNKGYKNAIYQASFCGYFPAEDPQYSMIVVVNSPTSGGYYGNVVAGSIFREVADKIYATNLNHKDMDQPADIMAKQQPLIAKSTFDDIHTIYKYLGFNVKMDEGEWLAYSDTKYSAMQTIENVMPDLKGMSQRDALFMAESMGLKVVFEGRGLVKNQSINAGERIRKGLQVKIQLS